jgi:hypothetical protein
MSMTVGRSTSTTAETHRVGSVVWAASHFVSFTLTAVTCPIRSGFSTSGVP